MNVGEDVSQPARETWYVNNLQGLTHVTIGILPAPQQRPSGTIKEMGFPPQCSALNRKIMAWRKGFQVSHRTEPGSRTA